jgi:nicotinate-nucleotide--dimethylbenzimidazole phosphoribosyltransferase
MQVWCKYGNVVLIKVHGRNRRLDMLLKEALEAISGLNRAKMELTQRRLDSLTKPLGSLGRLEDMVRQLAGITGDTLPKVNRKAVVIMCADNGVTEEGVSSCPKSVTATVTQNFMRGITGINVLARHAGAEILVVDIGVDEEISDPGIIKRKIRRGTWNIKNGPAMTREEAVRAMEIGIEMVGRLREKGVNLLGTGEMGIGNTTTSSAVATVLTGREAGEMIGKGAGLSAEAFEHKKEVVRQAIAVNRPDPQDAVDVLAKLGGFDIAGLAGCFIGAAAYRIPILVDGFISAAAALVAVKIKPEVSDFIFPSHGSAEPGSRMIMEALGKEPYLQLQMRLGEGTGAVLAFHIIDAAVAAYTQMGSFEDAEIEQYVPQE